MRARLAMSAAACGLSICGQAAASALQTQQAEVTPGASEGTAQIAYLKPKFGFSSIDSLEYAVLDHASCSAKAAVRTIKFSMALPVFMRPKYVREGRFSEPVKAGNELTIRAETISPGPVIVAGSLVQSSETGCRGIVSFVPQAGHSYEVEQVVLNRQTCAIRVIDTASSTEPANLTLQEAPADCR